MPFTNYLDQALVPLLFGNVSYTIPATWYVALSTSTPSQVKGTSTPYWNFTEPATGGYARVGITNNSTNWTAISSEPTNGYTIQNATAISFAPSTGSWGTVTYFGVWDTLTGGNLCGFGILSASQNITSGVAASFAIGALTVTNN